MNKTIFCDCFGVILGEIIPNWLPRYMSEEEAFLNKDKLCVGFDLGETTLDELLDGYSKMVKVPPKQVFKEWMELVFVNQEMVEYLKELRKDHKVYLLSNANTEFALPLLENNHLVELFDKMYISCEMRLIKPSVEYYQYVLKDLGLQGKDCIMIDDNKHNIDGAKKCNINGVVFTGVKDLKVAINTIESN